MNGLLSLLLGEQEAGGSTAFPKSVFGIDVRQSLFPGEDEFFKNNPHVAGMAAGDNKIILNPYSSRTDAEKMAVLNNEAARIFMRTGKAPKPKFGITSEQLDKFKSYSNNLDDIKQTIAARILSNDPSAGNVTTDQLNYVKSLRKTMGMK